MTSGIVLWFHTGTSYLILIGISALIVTSVQWWRDVSREASLQGHHPIEVETNMRLGIILFIASEVLFFARFFWAFFHSRLAPSIEIGILWPPKNISPFNPFQIPLLNTIILLSSGVSVTWAHHRLIENNHSQAKTGLLLTVILGVYFTALQAYEYIEAPFSFADSVYGSTFFIATGFHGLHVIIGTTFLAVCLYRLSSYQFSYSHHFGFEAAAWYWHFVDVVWLFLFISIYWWGSCFFSIKSIFHFQWDGLRFKKNNYIPFFTNNYYFSLSFTNYCNCFNNEKEIYTWPRKSFPFWMWLWPILKLSNSIFPSVLYNCNHFLNFWCRNCYSSSSSFNF